MPETQLISKALEDEVLAKLRSYGIVFWLDRDDNYSTFVDTLAQRFTEKSFPFPVVPFRGSYLETMLALEDHATGLDPSQVLVHMPGFTEDMMASTPLLELYKAGYRHRRALDTVIREAAAGHLTPDEIDEILADKDLTLERAEARLEEKISGTRVGVAELLDRTGIDSVVRDLVGQQKTPAEYLGGALVDGLDELLSYAERTLGMPASWVSFINEREAGAPQEEQIVAALAGWLLCVEYVSDLARSPGTDEFRALENLPPPLVKKCRELTAMLREQYPDAYESHADRTQACIHDELNEMQPEDLGQIDTFREEEKRILEAAIDALVQGDYPKAKTWAENRPASASFWISRDRRRRMAWNLVSDAAELGTLLDSHGQPFKAVDSFDAAAERYADEAYKVDQAHRRLEQQRLTLLTPMLPHFAGLTEVVSALRKKYRAWADRLALDFSGLCRKQGLLPDASLQQRNLFEQVVLPLTEGAERTAIFLIDALRYEMAAELKGDLAGPGTKTSLKLRLAELPTITSVGMNALAPSTQGGRLTLAGSKGFKGFSNGEFVVDDPGDRARAMGMRAAGEAALELGLAEVCEIPEGTLKNKVAQKKLIVVHSCEIDSAGEAGVGLATFDQTLGQIKAAWHHLKAAGVKQFVVTSDHGFLLMDETTAVRSYGKKTDPSRRHVLASENRVEDGMVTASLAELGYDGREGYVLFNEDTTVFDTKAKGASFVHGGNSPQERFIPVLTVTSKFGSSRNLAAYRVEARAEPDVMGCRRLRLRIGAAKEPKANLTFLAPAIDLALRVPDRGEIRATLKDTGGSAQITRNRLRVAPGDEWAELFFTLEGPADEQVRVEVFHPDGVEQVTSCQVDGWFAVEGRPDAVVATGTPGETASQEAWAESLPDDGTRQIFVHLAEHGSISEAEATGMLGSPRKFRKFSAKFEEHRALTPLRVRIEGTAGGKRYVREGRDS